MWYLNLKANPKVQVQIKRKCSTYRPVTPPTRSAPSTGRSWSRCTRRTRITSRGPIGGSRSWRASLDGFQLQKFVPAFRRFNPHGRRPQPPRQPAQHIASCACIRRRLAPRHLVDVRDSRWRYARGKPGRAASAEEDVWGTRHDPTTVMATPAASVRSRPCLSRNVRTWPTSSPASVAFASSGSRARRSGPSLLPQQPISRAARPCSASSSPTSTQSPACSTVSARSTSSKTRRGRSRARLGTWVSEISSSFTTSATAGPSPGSPPATPSAAEHHLELDDLLVVVPMDHVDTVDVNAVDVGDELQHG